MSLVVLLVSDPQGEHCPPKQYNFLCHLFSKHVKCIVYEIIWFLEALSNSLIAFCPSSHPAFCGHIELYIHIWEFGNRNYGWIWKCPFFVFLSLHYLTKNDFFWFHIFIFTSYGFTFSYSIPCSMCATFSLSIHMLKDIYVVFIFWLL